MTLGTPFGLEATGLLAAAYYNSNYLGIARLLLKK